MHYGSYEFSKNGKRSIATIDKNYQDLIGNRAAFTAGDVDFINLLYDYNRNQANVSACVCNEIEVSGLEAQSSRNGRYSIVRSLVNGRNGFSAITYGP